MKEQIDFAMIGWQLDYSRNRVLLHHLDAKYASFEIPQQGFLKRNLLILKLIFKVLFQTKTQTIFIPAFNQVHSFWMLILFRLCGKRIITDMLISDYDTLVHDRKLAKKYSMRAIRFYLNDWFCLKLSHKIICDTYDHKQFFEEMFNCDPKKSVVIPVGAEDIFHPIPVQKNEEKVRVLFYGGFSPLHGIHHIVEAAKLLQDHKEIAFTLIGSGQTKDEMVDLAKRYKLNNIEFISSVDYVTLPQEIAKADIGLGIFGASEKVKRVIPNKVYQLAACGKPIVTLRTPAIEHLFSDGKSILLVDENEHLSQSLAGEILKLAQDPAYRAAISQAALDIINQESSPNRISVSFGNVIASISA